MTTSRNIDPIAIEAAAKAIQRVLSKRGKPPRDPEQDWEQSDQRRANRKEEAEAVIVAYLDCLEPASLLRKESCDEQRAIQDAAARAAPDAVQAALPSVGADVLGRA